MRSIKHVLSLLLLLHLPALCSTITPAPPQQTPSAFPLQTGATIVAFNSINAATGPVDSYTVPTGFRAMLGGCAAYNTAGTTTLLTVYEKHSGTYYAVANSSVLSLTQNVAANSIVFDAADIVAIGASQTGLNVFCRLTLYPAAFPLYTVWIRSSAAGDNPLYTVPAGVNGSVLSAAAAVANNGIGNLNYFNNSGAPRTVIQKFTPSGGAIATYAATLTPAASATAITQNVAIFANLSPGDVWSLNVDASTATQYAFATVLEKQQ